MVTGIGWSVAVGLFIRTNYVRGRSGSEVAGLMRKEYNIFIIMEVMNHQGRDFARCMCQKLIGNRRL